MFRGAARKRRRWPATHITQWLFNICAYVRRRRPRSKECNSGQNRAWTKDGRDIKLLQKHVKPPGLVVPKTSSRMTSESLPGPPKGPVAPRGRLLAVSILPVKAPKTPQEGRRPFGIPRGTKFAPFGPPGHRCVTPPPASPFRTQVRPYCAYSFLDIVFRSLLAARAFRILNASDVSRFVRPQLRTGDLPARETRKPLKS